MVLAAIIELAWGGAQPRGPVMESMIVELGGVHQEVLELVGGSVDNEARELTRGTLANDARRHLWLRMPLWNIWFAACMRKILLRSRPLRLS
jgi:hypothetical protein